MRTPIYYFTDETSTGVNEINDGGLVVVSNVSLTGPQQYIKITGGTYTETSTIQDVLNDNLLGQIYTGGTALTTVPTVTGPIEGNELSDIDFTITNYNENFEYSATVGSGSAVVSGDIVTWTLPAVTTDTVLGITITAEDIGKTANSVLTNITITNSVTEDAAIVNYVGSDLSSFSNNFQCQVQGEGVNAELTAFGSKELDIDGNTIYYKDLTAGDQLLIDGTKHSIDSTSDRLIQDALLSSLSIEQSYDFKQGPQTIEATAYNADGSKLFVSCSITDTFYEYFLSTPYDVSTKSEIINTIYQSGTYGFKFYDNGLKLIITFKTGSIKIYTLSTAYDSTTIDLGENITLNETDKGGNFNQSGSGIVFNSNGTKLYLSQNTLIFEYDLSIAYDYSTAVFANHHIFTGKNIAQLLLNSDDSEITFLDIIGDSIQTYTFNLGDGDISNTTFLSSFSTSTAPLSETTPSSICFGNSGMSLYLVGSATDSVFELKMTTAYDTSTLSYTDLDTFKPTSPAINNPGGVTFNSTGDILHITIAATIYQYTLATPWDITTAIDNSTVASIATSGRGYIRINNTMVYNLYGTLNTRSMTGDDINDIGDVDINKTLSFVTTATTIGAIDFSENGNKAILAITDNIFNLSLSTPYDLNTAIFEIGCLNHSTIEPEGLNIVKDGSDKIIKIYVGSSSAGYTSSWDLGIPGDLKSVGAWISIDSSSSASSFNSDGTKFVRSYYSILTNLDLETPYTIGENDTRTSETGKEGILSHFVMFGKNGTRLYRFWNSSDITGTSLIDEYIVQEAYNLDTLRYNKIIRINNTYLAGTQSGFFRDNGTRFYSYSSSYGLCQFSLSTPYDISTATYNNKINPQSQSHSGYITEDGTKAYISSYDDLVPYDLSIPFDVTSAVAGTKQSTFAGAYLEGLFFNDDGSKMYYRYSVTIYKYDVPTPWDISTIAKGTYESTALTGSYGMDYRSSDTILNNIDNYQANKIQLYVDDTTLKNVVTTTPLLPLEITSAQKTTKLARSTKVTQADGLGAWAGVNSTTAKYKFKNIADTSSSTDTIVSKSLIEIGDVLTIYNDTTLAAGIDFTVTGVTYDGGAVTWTVDTTSVTAGTVPNAVFKNDTRLFLELDNVKYELLNRVNSITSSTSSIEDEVEMDVVYDDLTALPGGRDFNYFIQFFNDYDKMIELNGTALKFV